MPPADGKTLEELAAELDLGEVRHIPVGKIKPDPENANEMSDAKYEALVTEIRDQGFTQPVIVRPDGGGYMLTDGEHRWRAVCDLGFGAVPAIVVNEDDDAARIRGLAMNGLRGKPNAVKYAQLLADLAKRVPDDVLRKRLGLAKPEFEDRLRQAELNKSVGKRLRSRSSPKRIAPKQVFRVTVSNEDHDQIERVIEAVMDGNMDRGEAIAHICREFERAHKR